MARALITILRRDNHVRRHGDELVDVVCVVRRRASPRERGNDLRRHLIEHVGTGAEHGARRETHADTDLGVIAEERPEELEGSSRARRAASRTRRCRMCS